MLPERKGNTVTGSIKFLPGIIDKKIADGVKFYF